MFQYAVARNLALEFQGELLVEKRLGFILDREYRRKFELDELPTIFSVSNLVHSLPLYSERIKSFFYRRYNPKKLLRESPKNCCFERDFDFIKLDHSNQDWQKYWMSGYFQDPRYFASHKKQILEELTPPIPSDRKYVELAELSDRYNLIALGIRLFEESSTPEAHSKNKMIKSIKEFEVAIEKILNVVPNPLILVFTTENFDFLKSMNLPINTIYINFDTGYNHTINTLWLLSQCKHHVFNNSTFYWWGAELSQNNYIPSEQEIYCSDNFLNPEIAYPHWKKF